VLVYTAFGHRSVSFFTIHSFLDAGQNGAGPCRRAYQSTVN
jgi:hypothetical protein